MFSIINCPLTQSHFLYNLFFFIFNAFRLREDEKKPNERYELSQLHDPINHHFNHFAFIHYIIIFNVFNVSHRIKIKDEKKK